MFLKSELFEFNGANATLYELSALQRVELLHYLAAQEKALPNDEPDEQILSAALVELNIRAGAMVVAMSLWHSESPKPDIHELQQQVMSTWPVEAIGKADTTSAGDRAEDSAQGDLLSLQAQLKVLQQHTSVNDVISQQRKDLWQTENQYAVLEQAASSRQLSAQEKSLLAHKDETLEYKRQLAVLGDKVVAQQRLNTLSDQADKFAQQQSAKRAALDAQAEGVSSRQADRASGAHISCGANWRLSAAHISPCRIAPHHTIEICNAQTAGRLLGEYKLPAVNNAFGFILSAVPGVTPRVIFADVTTVVSKLQVTIAAAGDCRPCITATRNASRYPSHG